MPTLIIEDRICSHCGGNVWYFIPTTGQYRCSVLFKAQHKKYRDKVGNTITYAWRKKNKDKVAKYRNKYYDKLGRKYTERVMRSQAKARELGTDAYLHILIQQSLKNQGIKLSSKEIPKELIELQSKKLKIKRLCQQRLKELNQQSM